MDKWRQPKNVQILEEPSTPKPLEEREVPKTIREMKKCIGKELFHLAVAAYRTEVQRPDSKERRAAAKDILEFLLDKGKTGGSQVQVNVGFEDTEHLRKVGTNLVKLKGNIKAKAIEAQYLDATVVEEDSPQEPEAE